MPERLDGSALLLAPSSRTLRRQLRALTWVTLEDLAMDAVPGAGELVAHTSARQIAEHLGVEPSAVAGALRVLRDRGLVCLDRDRGLERFGLSVYVLGSVPGLTVVQAGSDQSPLPSLRSRPWRAFGPGAAS